MPARIIRQGINSSDRVDALTAPAEVFYRRLLNVADDHGRFDGDWRVLRSSCFPLRSETIAQDALEGWLAECSQLLPGAEESLVQVYFVKRKRYIQITNFGQRVRSASKFPGVDEGEIAETCQTDARNCQQTADNCGQLPAYARASDSHSSPHTHTHSNSEERGAGENQNGTASAAPPGFDEAQAFDHLAANYPRQGRTRLVKAREEFGSSLRKVCRSQRAKPGDVYAAILQGLERWQESELWKAGKVHWLGNWLTETLWRESPMPAADAKARAPSSRREKALQDFRRLVDREAREAHG